MSTHTTPTHLSLSELQRSMERFENFHDGFPFPDAFIVIRVTPIGRKEWLGFEEGFPYSSSATRALLITTRALMSLPHRVVAAYLQGDEISLVIAPQEASAMGRRSKIISTFASRAAIEFMKASGVEATFTVRVSELPSRDRCIEYFLWQRRLCFRNAVAAVLTDKLKEKGASPEEIATRLRNLTDAQRVALLTDFGVPQSLIPHAKRRGVLLFEESGPSEDTVRPKIKLNATLSDNDDEFIECVRSLLSEQRPAPPPPSAAPVVVVPKHSTERTTPQKNQVPQQPRPPKRRKKSNKAQVSVFRAPPA